MGLTCARYLSYCEKVRFRDLLRDGTLAAGASSWDGAEVRVVLVEVFEPVEAVLAWLVSIVMLDSAPDGLDTWGRSVVEMAVDGRDTAIPRLAALVSSSSRTATELSAATSNTWRTKSASASSGGVAASMADALRSVAGILRAGIAMARSQENGGKEGARRLRSKLP